MISVNNLYKNAKKWMKDSGLTGNEFRFKRRFNSDMSLVSIWCIVSTGDEEMLDYKKDPTEKEIAKMEENEEKLNRM